MIAALLLPSRAEHLSPRESSRPEPIITSYSFDALTLIVFITKTYFA
jgi:hypothetical protein